MVGDFNIFKDVYVVIFYYIYVNNKRVRKKVLNIKVLYGLIDLWKVKYE